MALFLLIVIIVAFLFYLWMARKRKAQTNSRVMPDEGLRLKNGTLARQEVTLDYSNKLEDLKQDISSKKQTIQELTHTLQQLKDKEVSHLQTIEELNRSMENLKIENQRFSALLMNHRNSIPILLKVRKDNSDLLFFYRELIHTIVYYNPVHAAITNFNDDLSLINKDLKKKEVATLFGESLDKVDFSDLEDQMREFQRRVITLLYSPFRESDRGDATDTDLTKREYFQEHISVRMSQIMGRRRADLETIEKLYELLNDQYERWRKILSRSWFENLLRVTWDGLKRGVWDHDHETLWGDILQNWENNESLNDNEFLDLYSKTVQSFIHMSAGFSKNLDIDFTSLEIIYQKFQEKEHSVWHEKAQLLLVEGDEISDLYRNWRQIQINPSLREYPNLMELIIDELRSKNLDESSIQNIRSLVTNGYIADLESD